MAPLPPFDLAARTMHPGRWTSVAPAQATRRHFTSQIPLGSFSSKSFAFLSTCLASRPVLVRLMRLSSPHFSLFVWSRQCNLPQAFTNPHADLAITILVFFPPNLQTFPHLMIFFFFGGKSTISDMLAPSTGKQRHASIRCSTVAFPPPPNLAHYIYKVQLSVISLFTFITHLERWFTFHLCCNLLFRAIHLIQVII